MLKKLLDQEEIDFICQTLNARRNHLKSIGGHDAILQAAEIDKMISKIRKLEEMS